MKLPASDREALDIAHAARKILIAIRNRHYGGELNAARYEEHIIDRITEVVEPYRERIAALDEQRRVYASRANEAYKALVKMKVAIRDVLAAGGQLPKIQIETLKKLEKQGYQHLRCKIENVVDEIEEQPAGENEDADRECEDE